MAEQSWAELQKLPGVIYRNRMYERSFSVELFRVNAFQLMTFLRSNTDPMETWKGINDLPSSHSVMREAARRLHNFLAAAMTLVDHTRVLIKAHYLSTSVGKSFKKGIDANFSSNPMTRFVQDLRNYMVHRAMPPLSRATKMTPTVDGAPGQVDVRVEWNLETAKLLEWSGWKAEAKTYLKQAPEEIDLIELTNTYQEAILDFHNQLDTLLDKYHEIDEMEAVVYEAELRSKSQ